MNVEQLLTERIGDTGKRLHTGRSQKRSGCTRYASVRARRRSRRSSSWSLGFMKALTVKSR